MYVRKCMHTKYTQVVPGINPSKLWSPKVWLNYWNYPWCSCCCRIVWWSTGWTVFVKQSWKGSGLQLEEVTMPTQWLLLYHKAADSSGAATEYSEPMRRRCCSQRRTWSVNTDVKGEEACTRKGVYSENFKRRMFIFIALGPDCDYKKVACFSCKMAACSYSYFLHILVFWVFGLFFLFDIQVIKLNILLEGSSLNMFLNYALKIVLLLIKMLKQSDNSLYYLVLFLYNIRMVLSVHFLF